MYSHMGMNHVAHVINLSFKNTYMVKLNMHR